MSAFLQGVQVNELQEFRCPFSLLGTTQGEFGTKMLAIWCYRGMLPDPQWRDRDEGKLLVSSLSPPELIVLESFSMLCTICFDLQEAAKTLIPHRKLLGQGVYYSLSIDVIISFGSTEFSAQVAWKVNVSCPTRNSFGVF